MEDRVTRLLINFHCDDPCDNVTSALNVINCMSSLVDASILLTVRVRAPRHFDLIP